MLLKIKRYGSSQGHLWGETFPFFQKCLRQFITSHWVISLLLFFIALENAAVCRARWDCGTRYSEVNKSPENRGERKAPGKGAGIRDNCTGNSCGGSG